MSPENGFSHISVKARSIWLSSDADIRRSCEWATAKPHFISPIFERCKFSALDVSPTCFYSVAISEFGFFLQLRNNHADALSCTSSGKRRKTRFACRKSDIALNRSAVGDRG
jgi:hypothetical protein